MRTLKENTLCLLDHYVSSSLKSGPITALRFRPVDTMYTSTDTSTSSSTYTKNIWRISQSHFFAAFGAKRHFMDKFRGAIFVCGEGGW
ncbi:hypothetical protein Clacol_005847 [Clathrus columnatus]|uniref:Uncharacterized protein n=1 Tax=Clathrus columnatus TaxID=1419009 RepID=A0AAV5AAF9_9AGAM|nr:hypothetical protein Clacol_005847 [Clathrus columnatus]